MNELSKRMEVKKASISEIAVLLLSSNCNTPKTHRNSFEASLEILKRQMSDDDAKMVLENSSSGF